MLEVLPYYKKNDLWVVPFIREAGAGQTRGQFAFTFEKNAIKRHTELTELVAGDGQYIGRNTKRKQARSYFDLSDTEKKEIVAKAADESSHAQQKMFLTFPTPPPITPRRGRPKKEIVIDKIDSKSGIMYAHHKKAVSPTRKKKVELKKRKQFFEESIKAEKTGKVTTRRVTSKTRPVKRPTNNLLHYVTETGTRRFDLEPVAKRVSKNGKRLGRPRKKKTLWQTLTFWKN